MADTGKGSKTREAIESSCAQERGWGRDEVLEQVQSGAQSAGTGLLGLWSRLGSYPRVLCGLCRMKRTEPGFHALWLCASQGRYQECAGSRDVTACWCCLFTPGLCLDLFFVLFVSV